MPSLKQNHFNRFLRVFFSLVILAVGVGIYGCGSSSSSSEGDGSETTISTIFLTTPADPSNFTLGNSPNTATFSGDASVFTVAITSLYISPSPNAWGLQGTGMGTIDFNENPASMVTVKARGTSGASATITVMDTDGNEIDSVDLPTDDFDTFTFEGTSDSIELTNTVADEIAVIGSITIEF